MSGVNTEPWTTDALCAQVGGDQWYVERGESVEAAHAKAVCRTCPVIVQCAAYVMAIEEPGFRHGIWAAMTPDERTTEHRRQERARRRERKAA